MTVAEPAGRKPVDVGTGVLVASFGRTNAALLVVLAAGPGGELAELSALPRFDESGRGDPVAARRYRAEMAEDRHACVSLETQDGRSVAIESVDLQDPARPCWRGRVGGASLRVSVAADGADLLVAWQVEGDAPQLRLRFLGRLDEPAFVEITETDPPPPSGARSRLLIEGARLRIVAPPLRTVLDLDVTPAAGTWREDRHGAVLDLASRVSRFSLRVGIASRPVSVAPVPEPRAPELPDGTRRIAERALAYVRGCTALEIAADERVLLADHRILPLSWTRDAYYQALLLLVADGDGDQERVADHLRWLWRRCERPDGRWVRSHRADGRRKDRAFQADQQLYPLLELADFRRVTGALPAGVDWRRAVPTAWRAARAAVDARTGLIATAENAADDPTSLPFLTSAQILLWYVARRLRELTRAEDVGLDPDALEAVALRAREGVARYLEVDGRWSYATDGRGTSFAYHDANDLPVALASLWGFCAAGDPVWRATLDFAFSDANPGFAVGTRAGLGSAHTPGAWTLGDVQAWLVARATRNDSAAAVAVDRLLSVSLADGMLPEAYSAEPEPDVRIRHWFAWPGAAWSAFLLLDARRALSPFLSPGG